MSIRTNNACELIMHRVGVLSGIAGFYCYFHNDNGLSPGANSRSVGVPELITKQIGIFVSKIGKYAPFDAGAHHKYGIGRCPALTEESRRV